MTRGVATAPNVGCVISEEWVDRAVVIRVAGVLDMLTSPQLEVAVAASLLKMLSAIIVDLTDVDFLAFGRDGGPGGRSRPGGLDCEVRGRRRWPGHQLYFDDGGFGRPARFAPDPEARAALGE